MVPHRGSRSRPHRHNAMTTTSLATLLAVAMLGWAGVVHADGSNSNSNDVPAPVDPAGHGPSNGPVITASFTSSFTNVTQGRTLNLSWSHIDPKYEPLSVTARVINRTTANRANGFLVTIAPRIYNASSFVWTTVPYPLPYMDTGLYELEIRPAIWNLSVDDPSSLTVPVLARSTFFSISGDEDATKGGSGSGSGSSGDGSGSGGTSGNDRPGQLITGTDHAPPKGPSRLALALGLSLGLAGALALTAVLVFLRRRYRQNAVEAEKRRRRRFAYMID